MNSQLFKAGLILGPVTLLLAACGGSSGSSSSGSSSDPLTGQFLDSPVANIGYRTASQEGTTNDNGEFRYRAGEKIRFFIGAVELPEVDADETVTPLEIAQAEVSDNNAGVDHPVAVNIARLLQTLDEDGDPDNGINIPGGAKAIADALASPNMNFNQDPDAFGQAQEILDFIRRVDRPDNPGQSRKGLRSKGDAVKHFKEQLGRRGKPPHNGVWLIESDEDRLSMLVLIETEKGRGTFYHAEVGDANEPDGLEYGTYSITGSRLSFTRQEDKNGNAGTNSLPQAVAFSISDDRNSMTLNLVNEADVTLTRVKSVFGEIQGMWQLEDTETDSGDDTVLFVFTESLYVGFKPVESNNEVGFEYGTYTFSASENNLQLGITVDNSVDSLASGLTITSTSIERNRLILEYQEDGSDKEARFRRR
ncbi:MAG: hypothetical protein ACR2PT_03745 [Endozoicomonas sp.]